MHCAISGAGRLCRATDLLRRRAGCYFDVKSGKDVIPLSYLTCYDDNAEQSMEFSENSVSFFSNIRQLELVMNIFLHNDIPCEFHKIAIKSVLSSNTNVNLLCYIEPKLMNNIDLKTHSEQLNMFPNFEYDCLNNIIIASRADGHGQFLAVGFCDKNDFYFSISHEEEVLSVPDDVSESICKHLEENDYCPSEPYTSLDARVELRGKEQKNLTLFLCCALSR